QKEGRNQHGAAAAAFWQPAVVYNGTAFGRKTAPTSFTVSNTDQLNAALAAIDVGGSSSAPNTAFTITFASGFTLTSQLDAINLAGGETLTIDGAGHTLNGGGSFNGLFVYAG